MRNFIITFQCKQARLHQAQAIQRRKSFESYTLIHAKDDEDLASMIEELKPQNFIAVLDMEVRLFTTVKRLEMEFNAIVLHDEIAQARNFEAVQGEHVTDSKNY